MVVDGRRLALAEHEERDQARRRVRAGVARDGVQRARRLVERLARLQHDRVAAVDAEQDAAVDHVHIGAARVPVGAAREAARLVVDADGLDGEPVAGGELEDGRDALAGVGLGHGASWGVGTTRPYVRRPAAAISSAAGAIGNHDAILDWFVRRNGSMFPVSYVAA